MAITIKIGKAAEPEKVFVLDLNVKRTTNGDLIIFDHADIDIIVQPEKKRIIAMPKDKNSDLVYAVEDRLFKFLLKRGLIVPDTIQGGTIYGSLEAQFPDGKDEYNLPNLMLLNIHEFVEQERPYTDFMQHIDDMEEEHFLNPDSEMSTELGEVPQEPTKGTLRPGYNYGPYWQAYTYEE